MASHLSRTPAQRRSSHALTPFLNEAPSSQTHPGQENHDSSTEATGWDPNHIDLINSTVTKDAKNQNGQGEQHENKNANDDEDSELSEFKERHPRVDDLETRLPGAEERERNDDPPDENLPHLDGNRSGNDLNAVNTQNGDSLNENTESDSLASLSWNELYQRFESEMQKKRGEEAELNRRHEQLTVMYQIWANTGAIQEEYRASKRLRTRVAYVTHSEAMLQERRQHRDSVVNAFENAMRLLD